MFKLPVVALPGELVPLHIFEPRYRRMVEYCIGKREPTFGIIYADRSSTAKVGTLMRIEEIIEKFEDGRYLIVSSGQERFRLISYEEQAPFPIGKVSLLSEVDIEESEVSKKVHIQLQELVELTNIEIEWKALDRHLNSFEAAIIAHLEDKERLALLELDSEPQRMSQVQSMIQFKLELLRSPRATDYEPVIQ